MVKFEGQLSDECVLYRTRYCDRVVIIGGVIVLFVGLFITVMLALFGNIDSSEIKETLIYGGILAVVILIFLFGYIKRKKPRVNIIIELNIDSDVIEYTVGPFKTETVPMSRIKKVIKIEHRYYIIRKFGDVSTSIMAEEALLKEGTIEQFEALFADKLVVRTK